MRSLIIVLLLFSITIFKANAGIVDTVPSKSIPYYLQNGWYRNSTQVQSDSGYLMNFIDTGFYARTGMIIMKTGDHRPYYWDMTKWNGLASSSEVALVLNTVDDLMAYTGSATFVLVKDSVRGGFFNKAATTTADSGIVFPASGSGSWIRDLSGVYSYNLKWWGAQGLGLSSYVADTKAWRLAISYLSNHGGVLYVPKAANRTAFYAYQGVGEPLKQGMIIGDGDQSNVRNINPNFELNANSPHGSILATGTIGVDSAQSYFRHDIPTIHFNETPKYQNYVVLRNIADTSYIHGRIGLPLVFGSNVELKNGTKINQPRFCRAEVNSVTRIALDTLYLSHWTHNQYTYDTTNAQYSFGNATGYPVIKIWDSTTLSPNGTNNIPNFIGHNIYIYNMQFSQALYNELTGEPYSFSTKISNEIYLGEIYEGEMANCTINGYGNFGGNAWNYFKFHDNTVWTNKKVLDCGFASNEFAVYDNFFHVNNSSIGVDTNELAAFYLNEGSGFVFIHDNNVSGNWSGLGMFLLVDGFHDSRIERNVINLPQYNEPQKVFMQIIDNDNNDTGYVSNNYVGHNIFNFNSVGQMLKATGNATAPANRNMVWENNEWDGDLVQDTTGMGYAYPVNMSNMGNFKFNDQYFQDGGDTFHIVIDNMDAQLYNLNARTSYLDVGNTNNGSILNIAVGATNLSSYTNTGTGMRWSGNTSNNTFEGSGAGASWMAGSTGNSFFGTNAGMSVTSGDNNTALGAGADMMSATTNFGIALGKGATAPDSTLALNVNIKHYKVNNNVFDYQTSAAPSGVGYAWTYNHDGSGQWSAVVGSNNYIVRETPSGTVNGSNTAFVAANTPVVGSEMIFEDGILQEAGGVDYSISGKNITFTVAPTGGTKIRMTYVASNIAP